MWLQVSTKNKVIFWSLEHIESKFQFQFDIVWILYHFAIYAVGSKCFRPDIQKQRQTENAVSDI